MKKIKIVAFSLFAVIFLLAAQSVKLKKVELRNKRGKMKVPAALTLLTDEEIVQRYGFTHLPLVMLADQSTFVTMSVTERIDSLSQSKRIKYANVEGQMGYKKDPKIEKEFYKATISGAYESISFLQDTVVVLGKKQWAVLEFEGKMKGKNRKGSDISTDNYNYIQYLIEDYRTITVSFNCPKKEKDKWQEAVQKSMKSLKIK